MGVPPDQLRDSLRRQPFLPFIVHLADGRHFCVPHPEFAMLSTSGRVLFVNDEDQVDVVHRIDTMLVTSVSDPAPD